VEAPWAGRTGRLRPFRGTLPDSTAPGGTWIAGRPAWPRPVAGSCGWDRSRPDPKVGEFPCAAARQQAWLNQPGVAGSNRKCPAFGSSGACSEGASEPLRKFGGRALQAKQPALLGCPALA